MYNERFEACVAKVRHRFMTTLASKIDNTIASADRLSRNDGGALKYVSESYRHLHTIYGLGATVGFAATGEAAHFAEAALLPAYHQRRGLNQREAEDLKAALARLRHIAASELRQMYPRCR